MSEEENVLTEQFLENRISYLVKNIEEARRYLDVVKSFGYNESTQKFLKSSYETFNTIDLSQISQEDFEAMIHAKIKEMSAELDVAYEGWFKNFFAKAAYALKSDAGVAKKIADKCEVIRNMSEDSVNQILEKECGFEFYTPEDLNKIMDFMKDAVALAQKNEEVLKDTKKRFFRHMSKDDAKSVIDRVKEEIDEINDTFTKSEAIKAKGNLKSDEASPKSYGWTKDKLVSVFSRWVQTGAGQLSKLKLLRKNAEVWGYDYKTKPGIGVNTNGDVTIDIEVEAELKDGFKNFVSFVQDTLDLYDQIDSKIYRFVKKF